MREERRVAVLRRNEEQKRNREGRGQRIEGREAGRGNRKKNRKSV